ncbi:MAG: hypothetical protein L0H12_01525, partial [Nitrosospira sp.]|nr:hypothetical protein [Nitrosospira sp.]
HKIPLQNKIPRIITRIYETSRLENPCNPFYIKPFGLGQAIVEIFQKQFVRKRITGILFFSCELRSFGASA